MAWPHYLNLLKSKEVQTRQTQMQNTVKGTPLCFFIYKCGSFSIALNNLVAESTIDTESLYGLCTDRRLSVLCVICHLISLWAAALWQLSVFRLWMIGQRDLLLSRETQQHALHGVPFPNPLRHFWPTYEASGKSRLDRLRVSWRKHRNTLCSLMLEINKFSIDTVNWSRKNKAMC